MTEFVYVKGKSKWFRHLSPEEFRGKSSWKHTIYLDNESLEKVRDLQAEGVKNVLKKDDDGYYTSFSRPTHMSWKDKKTGEARTLALDPPVVRLANTNSPFLGMVGNGSDIETKLEVYTHSVPGGGKAKAARWLATRVDTLQPVSPTGATIPAPEERALKGLDAGTAQGGW